MYIGIGTGTRIKVGTKYEVTRKLLRDIIITQRAPKVNLGVSVATVGVRHVWGQVYATHIQSEYSGAIVGVLYPSFFTIQRDILSRCCLCRF